MDTNEIENYFSISNIDVSLAYQTIQNIANQCEDYDLTRPLKIPRLPWKSAKFSYLTFESKWYDLIPMVKQFMNSDYDGDRLLVNLIIEKIHSDERLQNQETYDAVNTCLQMTWESSEVNKTHWSAYFLNLQKIIDVCWDAGTLVGPGRGSGVGFILLYLLDITQINPLWETTRTFPWRFLNPSRVSVLDVDVDIEGSRRGEVLSKLRQVYGQDKVAYMSEKLKWESENMKGDNPSDKYLNKDFPKGAELEYYNEFMSILKELKDLLPDSTFAFKNDNYAIQIRSSLVDRLKGSPMTEWGSQLKEVVKDSFIRREDETEYGVKSVLQDLKGNEVYSLPILFTNEIQGKDLSHDTNSTLYMFADMAVFYDEMSKIVDALELGRSLVNNSDENYGMKVTDTVGGKTKVSVINELGKSATQVITKKNSNIAVEYDNLVNSQVYGKRSKDEGTIGNTSIDKQKAANFATKFAGLSQLALNFIAASAAGLQDMVNVNSEAMGGQFFKFKHLLKADTTYFKNIGSRMSNMGNAVKSNKLDLFIEKYDIKHDFENESKYPDFAKSKLAKLLSTNSLYFLMSIGTDFGEVRTSLAKAYNTKVQLADGTITNLFDGQEVVPIDPEHPSYGYELKFPEGAVIVEEDKENNKNLIEISKAEDYSLSFSQMTLAINQRLYGIYNDADKNALKRTAEGKLLLQYRDWLVPAINRRYFSRGNNLMLNIDNDEGYYLTTLKFFKQLIKDSKELQTLAIKYTWSNLDSTQISNLKRAAAEVAQLGLVFVVLGTLKSRWKERDNPYALKLATLLARRLKTEMLAIMPTPSIITEFFRIVKEPIAAVDPIESLLTVFTDIFNPSKYEELQSGPYKGHSKLYRDVMNSPLIPFNSTIRRTLHPENALTYFNQ